MTNHVDAERWAKLSIFEQMGNIGTEVGSAINAKKRNDEISTDAAMRRATDLFDLTARYWAECNNHMSETDH